MNKALKNTLNLFNLTKIDANLFVWDGTSTGYGRIFGGQVMAQCLMAAYNTIQEKRYAHSFFFNGVISSAKRLAKYLSPKNSSPSGLFAFASV